jgi:hypothetical protein
MAEHLRVGEWRQRVLLGLVLLHQVPEDAEAMMLRL